MVPPQEPDNFRDPASESLSEALGLSLKILKIMMVILLLLFLASGVFMVEQHEVALILRFGKAQGSMADRALKPGLHWTWPYPFSEVVKVPIGRVHSLALDEFWYQENVINSKLVVEKLPPTIDPEVDGYLVSGDVNIIHSRWQIRYTISDPYLYHAKSGEPELMLRSVVSHAIASVVAVFNVHDVLTRGDELRRLIHLKAQELINSLDIGIELQGLDILKLVPARQTKDAFESVVRAEREQEKKMEEARNYKTQLINKTKGEYAAVVAAARNFALEVEKEAESDAGYFAKLLGQYEQHPQLFRDYHYQQVIGGLHDKVQELFLLSRRDKRQLRLQINRNPDLYRMKPNLKDD